MCNIISKKSYKLENANFELIKFLLDTVRVAQEEATENKEFKNFHLFSEKNKYIMNVFRHYNRILDFNDDIKKVEIFLRRFPNSKFLKENDIDELTYIKYHIEVLFHKIHTILEIKKLMINEVYEIGLTEKNCSWENLKKERKLKNNIPMIILQNYFKTFKDIIVARHYNTHRGYYYDEKEIDIGAALNIYKLSEELNIEIGEDLKRIMPKFYLKYKLKKFKNEKVVYVKGAIEATTYYKNEFVKYILKDYQNKIENWKNDST